MATMVMTTELVPVVEEVRMLKIGAVIAKTSLSRPTIYRKMATGEFPKRAKLGGSARWSEAEINAYCQKALAAR